MDLENKLKEILNRGKVAFAICCLENVLNYYQLNHTNWSFVIHKLWKFCNSNMAVWQEEFGEIIPFVVVENIDFKIKDYKYLSKEEHDYLQSLYKRTNSTILDMINLIYEIGITNILLKVNNESLKTAQIPYLKQIFDLMKQDCILLPDIKLFEKFSITENNGWGKEFIRDDIFNELG